MAALADFSRMPPKNKVAVFVVIGALLGLLYFQFGYKPLKEQVDEIDAQHAQKVAKNNQLDRDKDDYKKLKLQMCSLNRIIDENQTALPTEAELPAFFETLNRKVLESGVEVRNWQQRSEEKIDAFIKVPVSIEMTGTYMQIKKFFASLIEKKRKAGLAPPPTVTDAGGCGNSAPIEEHERIVSIENLSLTSPTIINHEIVLTAKFTAATYRAEDKNAGAAAPVRKQSSAPAPAGGAGSAAPPNPATPAGAKARADGAMEKDDNRTRKAPDTQEAQPTPAGSAKLKGGL